MPFADELNQDGVAIMTYQAPWAAQATILIQDLKRLVPDAVAIEHIGSTSIPGMASKLSHA